jgi:hypothetical protein
MKTQRNLKITIPKLKSNVDFFILLNETLQ